ncbi:tape measure protein [Fructobacillus sp. CRL 2054]|uniref:tape measure protein n=1 Tax=Fructobacillus sp. CRL 2054 TaxID=2763007 RepID=UPI0023791B1F|nr:tape measure protein [Fructobacillus sp. CRL 2054]MDD9139135.1 tape measure protein [Fructobacillus sp. CRL 2054]
MANKIATEMATNLTLDVTQAKSSLKELGNEVKSTNNAWKVQEAQMKSAGDAVGASKAKYDGLTDTVAKQKEKVDSLKTALGNVNTDTQKGKDLQTYLTAELVKAERQLNSYNGQLSKASESYKYQSSGLSKLNGDIQHNTEMTNANVKALEAEGKTNEANKAKLSGLQKTRESLNSILKIQQSELNKLSESGDKNSEAYKKQELRVAQMKAKIAEANKEIKTMNNHGIKINSSSIDKTREKLNKMNEKVNKTNHLFAKMLGANLVASGVTNALSTVTSHITGVVSAGVEYNKTMQNIQVGFDTFTNGNKALSASLTDNVKKIRETSGYTESVGAAMTKTAYGITKNKEQTEQLTNSLGILGRAYGKNDDQMADSVKMLSQMSATGKINAGSITKMEKQYKGFGDQLAKTMGVSRTQLNDFAKNGKISMNDVKNAMNDLAKTKPMALDNYYKTFDGFTNHFKSRYQVLSGEITKGFFSNSNAMLASLSKSLDGKGVDDAFNRFGNSVNKAANTIFGAFSKSFGKKGQNPVVTFADAASRGVEKLANFIAAHAKDIQNFFSAMGTAAKIAGTTMGVGLKIAIPLLNKLGNLAKNHKTTFKVLTGVIAGFVVALKGLMFAQKVAPAFKMLGVAIKAVGVSMAANPMVWFAAAVVGLGVAVVQAYKHFKPFRDAVNNIGKTIKSVFGGIVGFVGDVMGNIGKFISSACKTIGNVWNATWGGINSFFSGIWNGIKSFGSSVVKSLSTLIGNEVKGIQVVWNAVWGGISSFFGSIWGGIKSVASGAMNLVKSVISGAVHGIESVWNGAWNGISSAFTSIWDGITSTVEKAVNKVKSIIKGISDTIGKVGKSIGKLIPHFAMGGIVKENNQIVMVNDGTGPDWKELMHLPTGELMMSNQRNVIMPLPVGTRIYSGADTKRIMDKQGIKKYATGGVVGSHDGLYDVSSVINNFNPSKIIPVAGVQASNGYNLLNQSSEPRSTQPVQQSVDSSKLDQIISLLALILGVNKEQLAGSGQAGSLVGLYQQMSKDNAMRNWQRT